VKLIARADFDSARKNATDADRLHGEFARQTGAPYAMFGTPLLSPSGLPCNTPPWGTVAAVDLFTGKKVWDVPLGSFIPGLNTGTITLGGRMATAGVSFLPQPRWTITCAHLTLRPARNFGNSSSLQAARPLR